MLRFLTAGESHGPSLTAILEGLPAGLRLNKDRINQMLARRQLGVGSSSRMQIEKDEIEITSGVRFGETIGSPITIVIKNRDWENWKEVMDPWRSPDSPKRQITRPRPGHADLPGMIKYQRSDGRDILERASARETAIRTAVGAICTELLSEIDISIISYVISIGEIVAKEIPQGFDHRRELAEISPVRCPDPLASEGMVKLIDQAKEHGDTLGGVIETVALNVPIGLGSHVNWDRRLDSRISGAMMSIPAIKGVEIGLGFEAARKLGSETLDPIMADMSRSTNHAGGIEGGISNGQPILIRCAMKPLSTLMKPMDSVDLQTNEPAKASVERSDVCAVPRAAVVCEAVLAIELSKALSENFGGDTLDQLRDRVKQFRDS